jgi:hypothetical protein
LLQGGQTKASFCNACRRLVMDRVTMFLVFYPHPAIHPGTHSLFAETVRTQYKKDRYRKRKMSAEWCSNCREEATQQPKQAIDRCVAVCLTTPVVFAQFSLFA